MVGPAANLRSLKQLASGHLALRRKLEIQLVLLFLVQFYRMTTAV